MKSTLAAVAVLAFALPALAQDAARDWDIHRDPARKVVAAHVGFDSGLALMVRCVDGSYEAIIAGLPEPERRAQTRRLEIGFDDRPGRGQTWNVAAEPTLAVSGLPAPFARRLRQGGRLEIAIPDGGGEGRTLRHVLDLPASNAAIDETLTACGRPLVDPRDATIDEVGPGGLPPGMVWRDAPRPSYPRTPYAAGFAVLTCITQPDGRLRDCEIEAEHPSDGGFGEAALRSTRRARVQSPNEPEGAMMARRIAFRTTFRMSGH